MTYKTRKRKHIEIVFYNGGKKVLNSYSISQFSKVLH